MRSAESVRWDEALHASIGSVLDAIGSDAVRLASDPAARALSVAHAVLYDSFDDLAPVSRGVLLAAGLRPGAPLCALIRVAAGQGFHAVVVKTGGADLTEELRTADSCGVALIVVEDGLAWLQLERLLTTAIEGSRAATEPALSSLPVGDLFSLVNAIAAATGGAATIEDLHRRVLAYSTLEGQAIDAERTDGILGRQVPDLPENDQQYRELYLSPVPLVFPPTDTGLGRLACAVRAGTHPIGSIWCVDTGGNLTPDAHHLLAEAGELAALHLLRARSAEDVARQQRADLVRGLLESGDAAAMHQLGLRGTGALWVLAVEPADSGAPVDLTRLVDVLALELSARTERSGCGLVGGRAYAVFGPGRALPGDLARTVVRAAGTALRTGLRGGVGGPAASPAEVGPARRQADAVTTLLAARPALGDVALAEEVRDELTLARLAEQHPPATLSGVAAAVLDLDRTQGTDHAVLLRAWLAGLGDVRATARRLSVHPNTVRYRLARLRDLVGLDPSRPDQLLLVWLALRLDDPAADADRGQ